MLPTLTAASAMTMRATTMLGMTKLGMTMLGMTMPKRLRHESRAARRADVNDGR